VIQPDNVIAGKMRLWVMLNLVRVAAVAVSIGMGVRASSVEIVIR
jgi:hypothetical protein